jgi:hypothetical protein
MSFGLRRFPKKATTDNASGSLSPRESGETQEDNARGGGEGVIRNDALAEELPNFRVTSLRVSHHILRSYIRSISYGLAVAGD